MKAHATVPTTVHDGWMSVKQAAEIIGVEPMSVYRYIRRGELEAHDFGGYLLVRREDAERIEPGEFVGGGWSRLVTMKRLQDWNDAVRDGEFDGDEEGETVDPARIAAWEREHGWTHAELMDAVARWSHEEGAE